MRQRDSHNKLRACSHAAEKSFGKRRVVASPLVKRFRIKNTWGLFEGAFLGKVFLDGHYDKRLWNYLQKPRSYSDIRRYLNAVTKSDRHQIHLLKLLGFLSDEHFLISETTSTETLLKKSSKRFLFYRDLKHLYILPTLGCNFSCPHCFITANLDGSKIETIFIDKLYRGIDLFYDNLEPDIDPTVRIFGGEPLIEFNLVKKIVSHINSIERSRLAKIRQWRRGAINITTNAALIDEEMADWFYANNIHIAVSLDGRKKANDRMRMFETGAGTFDSIMKGVKSLQRSEVPFSIIVTIGRNNIDSIESDVKWMVSNLSKSISFNIMQDFIIGHNPGVISRNRLSHLTKVLSNIYTYLERNGIHESHYEQLWNRFINSTPRSTYCAANGGEVALMPDGSMAPCHHLVHGNKFRVYHRRGMRIQNTRVWREWINRTSYSIETLKKDCPYRLLCSGGCTVAAMKGRKGLNRCAPDICDLMEFHVKYMMEQHYRSLSRQSDARLW
jgi:uncharacterized protein